ncbi:MAG: ribonuclease HI family protein [Candidatus Nanoarchaeia archaeon]|jgi:ribonuclease HI
MELFIYTDGGSRGNPGKSAIGIVILGKDEKILLEYKEFIGLGTNNQAEYKAILKSLELAKKFSGKILHLFSDSELVVKQLKGIYKVKNPDLSNLYEKIKILVKDYEKVNYSNVKRSNKYVSLADSLVNRAMDEN